MSEVERFPRTGGLLMPVVAGVLAALLVGIAVVDGLQVGDLPVLAGCLLGGVVVWVVFLRPAVHVEDEETLVLVGSLARTSIPLVAVERVTLTRMLVVQVAGRRHVSTALARTLRSSMTSGGMAAGRSGPTGLGLAGSQSRSRDAEERPDAPTSGTPGRAGTGDKGGYPDFVEERVVRLAENARARRGVRLLSAEQEALADGVRREASLPAIGALTVAAAVFAATLLLV